MFAGTPASEIAATLAHMAEMSPKDDPLEVLRWVGENRDPATTAKIDDALTAAEITAAQSATPTPYAETVFEIAQNRRIPIAVVSNNSAAAIEVYLAKHGLTAAVVIGRPYAEPWRMKPDPSPLHEALAALGKARGTMIGDSPTDITAARAAGVPVIGYANRPAKIDSLKHADTVITSMGDVFS
ncbi:HAD-IA family hydrolase [Actinoplanes bogorensis]|uniref:HAD-IA family hydrolase n=1 Tax=Paractinoplanes bogorensis TaxID=1610840 RepID=A0ABS5Z2W0_9ACTN|nr:HAD-IA family hydrolase [Actinoplanes bogorensis]MBU2670027.1 HAD-IA family hydrolase [Actinoplanes bogorensis]